MNVLPRTLRARPLSIIAACIGLLVLGLVFSALAYLLLVARHAPAVTELTGRPQGLSTVVYTADGQELTRWHREYRTWVPYTGISVHTLHALLATEDHRFYSHSGVDFLRLASSAGKTLAGKRQGGSTLTMQLVRNLHPELQREPPYRRKIKEVVLALALERNWTKERILETYLNTVSFGPNVFGIEAAAQTFFSKSARALDTQESALLIGLLKGPSWYNPVKHPHRALQRRNIVLRRLLEEGHLDPEQFEHLAETPVPLRYRAPIWKASLAPHFAEHVRLWLEDWGERNGYDIYQDGLRVHTTLDARLQAHALAAAETQMRALQAVVDYEWSSPNPSVLGAESSIYLQHPSARKAEPFAHFWATHPDLLHGYIRASDRYRRLVEGGTGPMAALIQLSTDRAFMDSLRTAHTRLEAGLVAIDPSTAHVRAWVGGLDFRHDQFDKVALAKRQPGSTFKPFVYATAIDHGYRPDDPISAAPVAYREPGSNRVWAPRSAAAGASTTLRDALAFSNNAVAARLTLEAGPYHVAETARRMGFQSALDAVPSISLGTSAVTLLELTAAYTTLANAGLYREPVVVTRIEDRDGNIIARFAPEPRKAISSYTAYAVLDMLRGAVEHGTGARIRTRFGIREDVAGKTGTTQRNADGWFVLMHPGLVTGTWVGFNDPRVTFRSAHWGQGGHNALHVAGDFMRSVLQDTLRTIPHLRFEPPPGYRSSDPAAARTGQPARTVSASREPGSVGVRTAGGTHPDNRISGEAHVNPDADLERTLRSTLNTPLDSLSSSIRSDTDFDE